MVAANRCDLGQLPDPIDPLVAVVPDQPQATPWPEHARNLSRGPGDVHPVPCLGDQHRVDGMVLERQRLSRSLQRRHVRQRTLQLLEHPRRGIDRRDGDAVRGDEPRELAGTGTKVDHGGIARWQEPVNNGFRIARPCSLVDLRCSAERAGLGTSGVCA